MARKHKHPEHVNHERWLVSYADFVTLLFAFFVVMFSVSQVDSKKVGRFTQSFSGQLDWTVFKTEGGAGLAGASGEPPKKPSGGQGGGPKGGGQGGPANGCPGQSGSSAGAGAGQGAGMGMGEAAAGSAFQHDKMGIRAGLGAKLGGIPGLEGLQVLDARGELVLRMPDRLVFDAGAVALRPEGQKLLKVIAEELARRRVQIRVEGHTDSSPVSGRYPSNWELSAARAASVVSYLMSLKLFDPDRLSAAGYGEFHPASSNDSPQGRAQNRRVDLVVVADMDDGSTGP